MGFGTRAGYEVMPGQNPICGGDGGVLVVASPLRWGVHDTDCMKTFVMLPSSRCFSPVVRVLAAALVVSGACRARAQGWFPPPGSGGWSAEASFVRLFDSNNIVSASGTVTRVETFTPRRGMAQGIRAEVDTGTNVVTVHLGPRWYIQRQDVLVKPKQRVEVTGSDVTIEGRPVLVARHVKTDEGALHLRDANGVPSWAGGMSDEPRPPWRGRRSVEAEATWLPHGSVTRGEAAFRDLWCHSCHTVKGHETIFPAPTAQPPVPVVLGDEPRRRTRMDRIQSIVNPSHRIDPAYQRELVASGKLSRMGDYNETLTLQQLSDLVEFLDRASGPMASP